MVLPSSAHAELDSCGGIFLSKDANCEYREKEECMTECKTVAVEHSCVAKVYNACEQSCTSSSSTTCESSCSSSCVDTCTTTTTTEQAPSCMDLCLADCEGGDDDGVCQNARYRGACGRCTAHNCEKRCEEKCGDQPEPQRVTTTTECMPTCASACSASCTAKANTSCQVECQERTYVECEQQMVEQCETQCTQEGGAIFCDGQFVNASSAKSCADELRAKVKIDVDVKGALDRAGNAAENAVDNVGEKVGDGCSVSPVGAGGSRGSRSALGAVVPVFALLAWRIRRRRTHSARR